MKKKSLLVTVLAVAMSLALSGCSQLQSFTKDSLERTQQIIDAYQAGDLETFASYVEDVDKLEHMISRIQETDAASAEGMVAVYHKVYEIAKSAEFSAPEKSDSASSEYAKVKVKTVDYSKALNEAMLEAAAESGDAFADMPSWMMKALETEGEPVEKEIEVRVKSSGVLYDEAFNEEFLDVITVGFYDYIMYTMTSCKPGDGATDTGYLMASYDVVKVSLDEYVQSDEGVEFTDEEVAQIVNEFAAEFEGYDGITAGGNKVEGGIRIYMVVDCTAADMYTLSRLGLVNSANVDYIGLKTSVDGFESSGYVCETTDFGSGAFTPEEEE